jgi:molybdopterin/thiamine biosynthesis adenylyltransferase
MPLSGMPSVGPELPAGCTNVKVKSSAADPSSSSNKVDVTTLSDTARVYQDAPLVDVGAGATDGITETVTASFFGAAPEVNDDPDATGWICSEVETEYAVGDMIKGTATYVYKEPPAAP